MFVGGANADRSKPAWKQVYRALEHGTAKDRCRDRTIISRFPADIEDFANTFVAMQTKRHEADYDPHQTYYKSEVVQDIADSKDVIDRFTKVAAKDRRAFAAFILLKKRL